MQQEAVLKNTTECSTCRHLYFDLIVQEESTQDKMETEQRIVGGKTSKSQKRWRQPCSVDGSGARLLGLQVTLGGKTELDASLKCTQRTRTGRDASGSRAETT